PAEPGTLVVPGEADEALAVAFSPDRRHLAAWHNLGRVMVWDHVDGRHVAGFRADGPSILDVRFSPDGRQLLVLTPFKEASLWDAMTGARLSAFSGRA